MKKKPPHSHGWVLRKSQDGLLYVRFCTGCYRGEYLNQDRAWETMRYADPAELHQSKARGIATSEKPGQENKS